MSRIFDEVARRRLQRQLAQLPGQVPPPMSWQEFAPKLAARGAAAAKPATGGRAPRFAGIAAAAGVTGIAMFAAVALLIRGEGPSGAMTQPVPDPDAGTRALVFAGTLAASHDLEDRIAVLDELLSEERVRGARRDALQALEANRSELMGSLQQVRLAEQLIYD